jgi:hypothetical protein
MVANVTTIPAARATTLRLPEERLGPVPLLLCLGALLVGVGLLIAATPATNGDYGQWLMTARYFLGESVPGYRDISALPPLIPALLAATWHAIGDPVRTLRVFELVLLGGLTLGFALLGRELFRTREATFAAAAVALLATDRFLEMFAFGGLLQASAISLALFGCFAFVRASSGSAGTHRRWWWVGSLGLGLAGLAHVGSATVLLPMGVAVAGLAFIRWRQRNPATSLFRLLPFAIAPLVIVLVPVAVYWVVVLIPASRQYLTNPASLNYRGPEQLVTLLWGYRLNLAVVAVGSAAIAWGVLAELRRRVVGPYLFLLAWVGAAVGSLVLAVVAGAGTDYPRFAYVLLPPLVLASAGWLGWLSRAVVARWLGRLRWPGRDAALIGLTLAAIAVAPLAVNRYLDQAAAYGARDDQSLQRTVDGLQGRLSSSNAAVLADVRVGKWLEGSTGRAALFSQPVRFAFRPGEWQRSVDAEVLANATAAIVNEYFRIEYPDRAIARGVGVPAGLVIGVNHGGEYVNLLTLDESETTIGSATDRTLQSSMLPTGSTSLDDGRAASIRTEWRRPYTWLPLSFARTVRLLSGSSMMSIADDSPTGGVENLLRPAAGTRITSMEVSGTSARLCFSPRGNTTPCVTVHVNGQDPRLEPTLDGGLRVIGGGTGRTEMTISALTAGGPIVGLQLVDPHRLATAYALGGAIINADDPAYPETRQRLEALGFQLAFVDGEYAAFVRDTPAEVR